MGNLGTIALCRLELEKSQDYFATASQMAYQHKDLQSYWTLPFQQRLCTISVSSDQGLKTREKFIENLFFLLSVTPTNIIRYLVDAHSCTSLGYYLIYIGEEDFLPRKLFARLIDHVAHSQLHFTASHLLSPLSASSYFNVAMGKKNALCGYHQTQSSSFGNVERKNAVPLENDTTVAHTVGIVSFNVTDNRKIRIGFLSAYFYHHSVGLLMRGVFTRLRKDLFHKVLIHPPLMKDHVTEEYLRAAEETLELRTSTVTTMSAAIAALRLDVLVFTELGMDTMTYLLAFGRLAHRSVVFWGHAVTSGICVENTSEERHTSSFERSGAKAQDWDRGGPDYFVSSSLFESRGRVAQLEYSERLVLMDGLVSYFERPPLPLSDKEFLQLVSQRGESSVHEYLGVDNRTLLLPRKREFMLYLSAEFSDILPHNDFHIYCIPQTLYKLHPEFDALVRGVLLQDSNGFVVFPRGTSPDQLRVLTNRMEQTLGPKLMRRVLFVRPLNEREFITLVAVADVVLDPFPVGGGRSSWEIFSTSTPIVLWYEKTSILQLTAGMYQVMGVKCCVVHNADDYVSLAVDIASNASLQQDIRQAIRNSHHLLFEREDVVREWERLLISVVALPRPRPRNCARWSPVQPAVVRRKLGLSSEYSLDFLDKNSPLSFVKPAIRLSDIDVQVTNVSASEHVGLTQVQVRFPSAYIDKKDWKSPSRSSAPIPDRTPPALSNDKLLPEAEIMFSRAYNYDTPFGSNVILVEVSSEIYPYADAMNTC